MYENNEFSEVSTVLWRHEQSEKQTYLLYEILANDIKTPPPLFRLAEQYSSK